KNKSLYDRFFENSIADILCYLFWSCICIENDCSCKTNRQKSACITKGRQCLRTYRALLQINIDSNVYLCSCLCLFPDLAYALSADKETRQYYDYIYRNWISDCSVSLDGYSTRKYEKFLAYRH